MSKKPRIVYSKHAEEQLKERDIDKKMVRRTLLDPHQVCLGRKNTKIAQRIYNIGGQEFLHRVVFVERADSVWVITTYVTTKIEKYWRRQP